MIASYLKSAFRSLIARPGIASIQILGLALGLACCLLVGLYLKTEVDADGFHQHADRTYRVLNSWTQGDQPHVGAMTSPMLAQSMIASLPEVEAATRIKPGDGVVTLNGTPQVEAFWFADPSVFDVFTFPLTDGDAQSALRQPDEVVLSAEAAVSLFGTTQAVGKVLPVRVNQESRMLTVVGVMAPLPASSSLRPSILIPYALEDARRPPNWGTLSPRTYVRLADGASADEVSSQLSNLGQPEDLSFSQYSLQPLRDIHWTPEIASTLAQTSNPAFPRVLGLIALFVLLVACINFTTLALASGSRRAREVGVRKSLGAGQRQLALQFGGEAVLTAALATALGALIASATLPAFRSLVGLDLRLTSDPALLIGVLALPLIVGVLAGSYPAVVLSRFRPTAVLRGSTGLGRPSTLIRGLAGIQFMASAGLILATLLMSQQLRHIQNQPLGFDAEHTFRIESEYGATYEGAHILTALRAELADDPRVTGLAGSTTMLYDAEPPQLLSVSAGLDTLQTAVVSVSPEYVATLGLRIVEGRDFEVGQPADSSHAVLVNEAFVRAAGWNETLGRSLSAIFMFEDAEVIGVVNDFHLTPLYEPIQPTVLHIGTRPPAWDIYARIPGTGASAGVAALRSTWEAVAPEVPFQITRVRDDAWAPYAADERTARLVLLASLFAIGIACLGLFALARLESLRRTQEVGIRKVLGASTMGLTTLLTRQFALIVVLAFAVAAPLTVLVIRRWLDTFAYRIDIGPTPILSGAALTLSVALVVVGASTIQAALADPVESLRTE